MMKRIVFQMIGTLVLLLSFCGAALAEYPRFLNGDPNCIIIAGHQGTGWYIKKNSVRTLEQNGPIAKLSIEVLAVPNAYDGNVNYSSINTYEFYYDASTDTSVKMGMNPQKVMGYFNRSRGEYVYVDPNASMAEIRVTLPAGEMAYAIKYRKKFYGDGIYTFGDSFYNGVLTSIGQQIIAERAESALINFHKAITEKQYRAAYNLLSPEMQNYVGGYDKFVLGYGTTISSKITEINIVSKNDYIAQLPYMLEAKDRFKAGTLVQRFTGVATLKKDGSWKISEITAKKVDERLIQ